MQAAQSAPVDIKRQGQRASMGKQKKQKHKDEDKDG